MEKEAILLAGKYTIQNLYSYFDPMNETDHAYGKTLANGLIITKVTQAS